MVNGTVTFRNNEIVNVANGMFIGSDGVRLYNNVFYDAGTAFNIYLFAAYDVQSINNAVCWTNGSVRGISGSGGTISNNFTGSGASAGFVSLPTGSGGATNHVSITNAGDFRLKAGSPLMGTGTSLSPAFPNRDGVARPRWNIGAY